MFCAELGGLEGAGLGARGFVSGERLRAAVAEVAGKPRDGVLGRPGRSVRAFMVFNLGTRGNIEVGGVAGAGGDRVAGLLIEVARGQGEGAVDCGALELWAVRA